MVRPRARSIAVIAIMAVAFVLAIARPASAHVVEVEGSTSCPDGTHHVSWTIHNVETAADRSMIIVDATAEVGGETYPVTGYEAGVEPDGTTVGTTIVPGDVTGTIETTVRVRWPDDYRGTARGSVELEPPCEDTTTTTTPTTGPTTTAPTTPPSTEGPPNTGGTAPSTAAPPPSTGPGPGITGGVEAEEAGAPGSLPRTGRDSTNWALVGVAAIGFGATLLAVSKRGRRFARH
jgi:LPXTG-motif cell wall-anchored protein